LADLQRAVYPHYPLAKGRAQDRVSSQAKRPAFGRLCYTTNFSQKRSGGMVSSRPTDQGSAGMPYRPIILPYRPTFSPEWNSSHP